MNQNPSKMDPNPSKMIKSIEKDKNPLVKSINFVFFDHLINILIKNGSKSIVF